MPGSDENIEEVPEELMANLQSNLSLTTRREMYFNNIGDSEFALIKKCTSK